VATEAPTHSPPRAGSECPNCGAHADPGQLVCLECGARLALDYRRPQGWRPAALVVGIVLLVAMAAFALTLVTVDDDAREEVAATKAGKAKPAATANQANPRKNESPARERRDSTSTSGGVPTWPENRDGFTVVLLSTGDEASARAFARSARRGDVDAGMLRSDDFSSLEKGFWIVYAGVYRTRAQAERAAGRLGSRFSGSYPQFVNGADGR
jgi:septal ring-binding cell division protein DamX